MSDIKFRNDIVFLRAVAVTSVLLYHLKVPFFNGGLLGVDIFFVISGYLMTKIVLSKLGEGQRFSLKEFYIRRIQRIIPALLFLIFILTIVSYWFLTEDTYQFDRYALVSELFISNIFYLRNSSYFDNLSQNNVLLHTCSLSAEWQFYLIYPLLLLPLRHIFLNNYRFFKVIFLAIILGSFGVMVYYNLKGDSAMSFYGIHTRAWEMMLGGYVFLSERNTRKAYSKSLNLGITLIALILIVLSICYIDDKTHVWPSWYTLIPVLSTVAIIYQRQDWKLYQNKGVQFFGNISYSLYLWHWPFFVLFQYFGVQYNYLAIIILILLSVIAATLSYKYVENNKKWQNPYIIVTIVICFAAFHWLYPKWDSRRAAQRSAPVYSNIDWNEQTRGTIGCNLGMAGQEGAYDTSKCLAAAADKPNVLLIGDSHGGSLALSLQEQLEQKGINLLQMTFTGNAPLPGRSYHSAVFSSLSSFLYNEYTPA